MREILSQKKKDAARAASKVNYAWNPQRKKDAARAASKVNYAKNPKIKIGHSRAHYVKKSKHAGFWVKLPYTKTSGGFALDRKGQSSRWVPSVHRSHQHTELGQCHGQTHDFW